MKKLSRGMVKDTSRPDQPEGTMRDALNANLHITKGSVVNEYGTNAISSTANFRVFGSIALPNDEIVVFGKSTIGAELDEIRLVNTDNGITTLLFATNDLNFKDTHPIVATTRKNQAQENLVYFTDGYRKTATAYPGFEYVEESNPPRVINITRQLEWRSRGGDVNSLYNALGATRKMDLIPRVGKISDFTSAEIITGGSLTAGAYYLALAYSNPDGLETNYFAMSNPVYIVPGEENALPSNVLVGAEGGSPTNKAIKWHLETPGGTELDYKLIQPAVIRVINEEQTAFKLPPVRLENVKTVVTFTGNEQDLPISVEDILVDDVTYSSAEAIAQLDNRLYLGNVTSTKDVGFQPFAHNIQVEAVIDTKESFNPRAFDTYILNQGYAAMMQTFEKRTGQQFFEKYSFSSVETEEHPAGYQKTGDITASYVDVLKNYFTDGDNETLKGYRSSKNSFKNKSFRRSEVYAFYISFVLNDGTETYAYHIPGREARAFAANEDILESSKFLSFSDSEIKDATGFRPEEFELQHPNASIYQVVDTGHKTKDAGLRDMSFWENENELYPNTESFLKGDVTSEGEVVISGENTLAGQKVRHHKFPGNNSNNENSFVGRGANPTNNNYPQQATTFSVDGDNVGGETTAASDLSAAGGMMMDEEIKIMGIKLKNLKIPKYILKQIQGYKIYYAKRNKENKTILGQSVAIPGHPRYATVKEQALADAVKGPYKRAFYMYGGLSGDPYTGVDTIGHWKGTTDDGDKVSEKRYWAHPVFKIHDFNLLRNRDDLSAATHVQCQYGVAFRLFQGGPGTYVESCDYNKIDRVKADPESGDDEGLLSYQATNDVNIDEGHSTTFPSLGWVSPEMKNTVDFYWHDPMHLSANSDDIDDDLFGISRVLDISDVIEGDAGIFDEDGKPADGIKSAKRARRYRKGDDLSQPAEGQYNNDTEKVLAIKAKESRIRAWYTSVMLATIYIRPGAVLANDYVIKGGDYKGDTDPEGLDVNSSKLGRFYSEGNFDDNQLTLTIEPGGKILLNGRQDYESSDAAAFKGASYLYNRAGETAHALSLSSGLPALRGYLPFWDESKHYLTEPGYRVGLTRWSAPNKWLFPDAPIDHIPVWYQRYGNGLQDTHWFADNNSNLLYKPSQFRGLKYSLEAASQYEGLPMAWMVNICSFRTEVYAPFDQQQLVWTGYYQKIQSVNLETGGALSNGVANFYEGAESGDIYGGDTYITRHGVRVTSQSYGHAYFRAAQDFSDPVSYSMITKNQGVEQDEGLGLYLLDAITTAKNRPQGDIPTILDPNKHSNEVNKFGTTNTVPIWNYNSTEAVSESDLDDPVEVAKRTLSVLKDTWNWVKGDVNPVSTILYFVTESDDLIEFRHHKDVEAGQETKIFDYHTAANMLFDPPTEDYTNPDKMLYGSHYSAVQDLKVTQPLPIFGELEKENVFPRRVVRSDIDSGTLADGYRKFRGLNFKDVPSQRGEIKALFNYRNTLYINTTRSLFVTTGKEELQIGAATAFIGNGDIFSREPLEAQESTIGYGGTTSRHAHVTTRHGHFYVNRKDRKIFMAGGQGLMDITPGVETWLRENMPFKLEQYGVTVDGPLAEANGFYADATTGLSVRFGFTIGYDPVFDRVLITKHEPIPTDQFVSDYNAGKIIISEGLPYRIPTDDEECKTPDADGGTDEPTDPFDANDPNPDTGGPEVIQGYGRQKDSGGVQGTQEVFCGPLWFGNPYYFKQGGWTLSYYPTARIWGSRHSYRPSLYSHTTKHLVSFNNGTYDGADDIYMTWTHSNSKNPGRFYGRVYNFEVEFIDNTGQGQSKIFSNFYYWAESYLDDSRQVYEINKVTNPVFDKFYAYNSTQITGTTTTINYLNNARLVDRVWYVNDIRDYAKTEDITNGDLITNTENVAGYITSTVTSHIQTEPMFSEEGVVNPEYVDTTKEWYNRRKLIDHYMGVRLIHDNSNRNLVHLYAVGTKFRKSYR